MKSSGSSITGGSNDSPPGLPPEFRALLERHARLGQLLPPLDDLDLTDPRERAELELILSEMEQVKAEIDAFLAAARAQS